MNVKRMAPGIGWFSIALGVLLLVTPKGVSRALGIDNRVTVLRVIGVREIVVGVGILRQPDPAPWQWGRVIGDIMDVTLMLLGVATGVFNRSRANPGTVGLLGATALDLWLARRFDGR